MPNGTYRWYMCGTAFPASWAEQRPAMVVMGAEAQFWKRLLKTPRLGARSDRGRRLLGPVVLAICILTIPISSRAQASFTGITSFRVNGAPDYSHPGAEVFWSGIPWTDVPLTASRSPGGGHTPNVLVKSANDGYNVYLLFRWNDSVGPSYASNDELWLAPNGTLVPLTDADTANVTQLFYNATYYYQDRLAILWFIADTSELAPAPVMQLGTNGAITMGAADIWHWQSNPTDNDPLDTGFPGGYTDPTGRPIYPADNLSYAEDDYTNMTGFWITAGSFGAGAPNLDANADPYVVHAGNAFDSASAQWTVEMVRTFTTTAAVPFTVQLATGSGRFVAFAVWNGRLGESAEFKSVSQWYNLTVSAEPASNPAGFSGGVNPSLAAVVAIGTLCVGVAIGVIFRWKPERENRTGEERSK